MLAVRTLGRMRARDRPDARARSLLRVVPVDFRLFFEWNEPGTNLYPTILCTQFVCFNTNFLAIIDLGSKTYIGL